MDEQDFEEKPIPLITEGFDLETDGIEFLQKLSDKNIAVISIIGPVFSGKSFLASQLSGKINKGFEINTSKNKEENCTKGIWIWGKPIIKDDYYIIILDAQGFKIDTEENLEYSQKIFSLCTLISSLVIYNYKDDKMQGKLSNEIYEESFNLFNKIIQFLQKIKLEDNEELSDENNKITSSHIPDFFWVYRDCSNTDFNIFNDLEKKFKDENEYFNNLFKNKIRKYTLPCPMDASKMVENKYLESTEEEINKGGPFNEEYKSLFNNFKNKIINNCTPKLVKNLSLNGNLFYGLLQEYASAIYSGENMFVESPLSNIVFSNLGEITEGINDTFKEKLEEKNGEVYDIIEILKNSFEIFSDGLLNEYQTTFIGKLLHSQYITEQMNNILSSVSDEVLDTNISEKLNEYNSTIKELTEKEGAEKINEITSTSDIKKSLYDFSNKIKTQIEENLFKKENEFLSSFSLIKDYIIKCICNKINLYADNIQFYIEHNLQSIESSYKYNDEVFEAKIKELSEKGNELIKLKIEIEKMEMQMKEKEKEFQSSLDIEKQKYVDLEKYYKDIINIKDAEIKKLEEKNDKINQEIKNQLMEKKNEGDITKLKDEIVKLKLNLVLKEKQINSLNSNLKEFDKDLKIPELKEIFKNINKTVLDYADLVKKFEENKHLFFHDKFIENVKSQWSEKENDWRRELNQFKESHFKTMENNYKKEIDTLIKEKEKLYEEKSDLKSDIDNKDLEIAKLQQKIESDKEIIDLKQGEIQTVTKNKEAIEMQLGINEVKIRSMEKILNEYKIKANILEEQIENIIILIESISKKDKRKYSSYFNKIMDEQHKNTFKELVKNLNLSMFKS